MNVFTIDIEEWYTYEQFPKGGRDYYLPIIDNYLTNILSLLEQNNIKGTFFCLGDIARNNPSVIKKISEKGHEIGCHSDKHLLIKEMSPFQFKEDTKKAITSLEQTIGKKITMYRAPAFSITEKTKWALEILIELGIEYDSSIFPTSHRFGGFPLYNERGPAIISTQSGTIKEFPINFAKFGNKRVIFSGGGYFRFFPYWMIYSLTKKSDYNMAYFHIRDLDKHQKKVSSANSFYSYYGIKDAYHKFEKYVSSFPFVSLGEASNSIDWAKSKIISL